MTCTLECLGGWTCIARRFGDTIAIDTVTMITQGVARSFLHCVFFPYVRENSRCRR